MTPTNVLLRGRVKAILQAGLIGLAFTSMDAYAQVCNPQEVAELLSGDRAVGDAFGFAASLSSDYAVVGTPWRSDNGLRSGAAYVFKRSNANWIEHAKLLAPDGSSGDWFGYSVDITSDVIVVGAFKDDDQGSNSGSAWVFRRSGDTWVPEQKLTAPSGASGDEFAYSVSISGDVIVVGAWGDDDLGRDSGSAYVFRFDSNTSEWKLEQQLTAPDGAAQDEFGFSVSLSDDAVVVGAYGDEDYVGSAWVFRDDSTGTWEPEEKLTAADGAADDVFGISVDISGDVVAIGAHGDDDLGPDSGSAYFFRFDGIEWTQETKLVACDGGPRDEYGAAVVVSGDQAIIGAYGSDILGEDSGEAYFIRFDGNEWVEVSNLTASDGGEGEAFGVAPAIWGDTSIIGAPLHKHAQIILGSAYVFDLAPDVCPTLLVSPDPLIAGQSGVFEASDFRPTKNAYLAYSTRGPGCTYIQFLNVTIDLQNPKQAGNAKRTDDTGFVRWTLPIPANTAGLDVWFQVVQAAGKTNVVSTSIVE